MRASGCASSRRRARSRRAPRSWRCRPASSPNETLRFSPALPDKLAAAHALPLGVADKVFLSVERAEDLPVETRLFASTRRTETGGYTLRPFGRPLIDGYFGGPFARALEPEEGGFANFAIDEICAALGNDMRKRLTPIVESAWARDPWALGAYSYGSEGAQAARATLAAPVDDTTVLRRRALLGCGFLHRARGVSHRRDRPARGRDQGAANAASEMRRQPEAPPRRSCEAASPGSHSRQTSARTA